jgi:TrmH family RNA methyltransferase
MITSPANERIKWLRKLHERKARQESGLFYIEGLRIVTEAIQQGAVIETLVVAYELLRSEFGQQLVAEQRSAGRPVLEVSGEVFQRIALKDGPQGLAAVVRQQWVELADVQVGAGHNWVALDAVADPGNLGTILRTHDAVGGRGVILLDQSTDPYDPSAARASMGALFTQRLVKASFAEFAAWKRQTGAALVGTSGAAEHDYHEYRYPDGLVVLMGSERQGLQPHHLALCDGVVSIPMRGESDSLNLAVATAVVLYEILNQRRDKR